MDVFDLQAKLGLDDSEYTKGLNDAEGKASSFGSNAISKIGGGLKTAAKIGVAAVGTAATAIGGLTAAAVNGYAEFEQLEGGVKKLYGNMGMSLEEYAKQTGQTTKAAKKEWENLEEAQNLVLKDAQNAYKDAGMSANDYLQTATSFSAALIKGLNGDTKKAAEMTKVAMVAMSDNVNTFGTDAESVQSAFQGFAKQNYTMLDNLKLGYGGTATGMVELIKDSGVLGDAADELTAKNLNQKVSFDQIVQAIQAVQEQQNIAGTTSREATSTIEGSLTMVKSAWQNLVDGFANPDADISQLVQNVMESLIGSTDEAGNHINGFVDNVLPAIQQALAGIGTALTEGFPQLLETVGTLITEAAPGLLDAAITLVGQIVAALPDALNAIIELIPTVFESIITALSDLGPQLAETLPTMFESLMNGITEFIPQMAEVATALIQSLIDGFSGDYSGIIDSATETINEYINALLENLPALLEVGVNLLNSIVDGIIENLPTILESAEEIVTSLLNGIVDVLPELLEAGVEIITNLVDGISENLPTIIDTALEIIQNLVEGLLENLPEIINAGIDILTGLIDGLGQAIPDLIAKIPEIISAIWDTITNIDWFTLGSNILTALIDGLVSLGASLGSALLNIFSTARETIKNVDWLAVGKNVISAIVNGIAGAIVLVVTGIGKVITAIRDNLMESKFVQTGANIIAGIVQGIANNVQKVKDKIIEMAKGALDAVKSFLGIHSPSKKFEKEVGKNIADGTAQGIDKNKKKAKKSAEDMAKETLQAAQKVLEKRKIYHDVSVKDEEKYWQKLRKKVKKGTEAYQTIVQNYYAARLTNQENNVEKVVKNATKAVNKIAKIAKNNYDGLLSASKKWLDNYKNYHDVSLQYETKYWNQLRKKFKKGTQERIDADKQYYALLLEQQTTSVNNIVTNATKAAQSIAKATKNIYEDLSGAAKNWLSNYQVYHTTSLKYEMEYWDEIRKQYKEGTQERIDADKQYYDTRSQFIALKKSTQEDAKELTEAYAQEYLEIETARDKKIKKLNEDMMLDIADVNEKLADKLSDINDNLTDNIAKVNEKLQNDINGLTETYNNAIESRVNTIMGMTGLFDRVSYDRTYSKEYLMEALNEQVGALEEWDKQLDALQSKLGRDNPLLKSLEEMGVSSLYTLQEVNSMSDEELREYSKLYEKKTSVARDRAIDENASLLDDTNRQIENLRRQADADIQEYQRVAEVNRQTFLMEAQAERQTIQDEYDASLAELLSETEAQLKTLTDKYTEDLKKLAESVKTEGSDIGKSLCDGISEGIKNNQSIISAAARSAVESAMAEAKAAMNTATDTSLTEGAKSDIPIATKLESLKATAQNVATATGINIPNSIIQNLTVNAPKALDPSEIARQTKLANQQMVLALKV